jgi:hypothetical protein
MSIPVEIQGSMAGNGLSKAAVINPHAEGRTGEAGLLVYTRERLEKAFTPGPLLNSEFGISMNQNGAFSGTPDQVHNGIDSVLWTGSQITGTKVTFDSADQAFAGTKSVKVNNPNSGDIWEFDKGSNLTVSSYTALTIKIYIDSNWTIGDSVSLYAYDTGGSVQVGTKAFIEDYVDTTSFDVWQSVTIPLTDMSLSGTLDAFRMEQESKTGQAATFYIDNFHVEEVGSPILFTFDPNGDQIFHITRIGIFAAVNGVSESALQAYDKFYSLPSLSNGVGVTIQSNGNIVVSAAENSLFDQIVQPQVNIQTGGDGTNSWIKVFNDIKFDLDGRKRDFIEYRIQDDLTGLTAYSVWIFGWAEKV